MASQFENFGMGVNKDLLREYMDTVEWTVAVRKLGFRRWEVQVYDNFGLLDFREICTSKKNAFRMVEHVGHLCSLELERAQRAF